MKKIFLYVLLITLASMSTVMAWDAKQKDFEDLIGLEIGMIGRNNPDAIGFNLGFFNYPLKYYSVHGGISLLASEDTNKYFGGLNLGTRFSIPKRISPFLGVGVFGGWHGDDNNAENDLIDNDDDGEIDEKGETRFFVSDVLISLNPEFGIHFWITKDFCITSKASYNITTEGRQHDFWYYGFSFGWNL